MVSLILAGCADEAVVVPAEFGETCGVKGPVRLFAHGPDEAILSDPRRIGERLFFTVYSVVDAGSAAYPWFPVEGGTRWATGVCEEAPVRVDSSYRAVFSIERWPDVALACHGETGDVVSLAASGPLVPHVVFPDLGCSPVWTGLGPVARNRQGKLVLYLYPEDPRVDTATKVALPETAAVWHDAPIIAAAGDELLVLRPSHDLVAIDLHTLAVTSEQFDVISFVASPSGRYVLTQAVDPGHPEVVYDGSQTGPLLLRDRETGVGMVVLREGQVRPGQAEMLEWADEGYAVIGFRGDDHRVYHLPELSSVAVPPHYRSAHMLIRELGPVPGGRWIFQDRRDGSLHELDLVSGALTPMFARPVQILARAPEGTFVLAVPPCCGPSRADDEGPVWYVPDDGSEATVVADRATLFGWSPREDSLISLVDIDARRRGKLVRIDLSNGGVGLLDDHVFATILGGQREPDVVRYSVQDGERSGVWQVRLAP